MKCAWPAVEPELVPLASQLVLVDAVGWVLVDFVEFVVELLRERARQF